MRFRGGLVSIKLDSCKGGGRLGAVQLEIIGTMNIMLGENILFRPEIRYDKIINVSNRPSHTWYGHNRNITGPIAVTYQF